MKISIIVPTLNEETLIRFLLERLLMWPDTFEIIVVDGGSEDQTGKNVRDIANSSLKFYQDPTVRGRAAQMNFGAQQSGGDVLLFLHADCEIPRGALHQIEHAMQDPAVIGGGFYKKYAKENIGLKIYRVIMNTIRTKWLHNLVGTNAIFIRRDIFFELGQYPDIQLLEDVVLCDRMKKKGQMAFLKPPVVVSPRRYYQAGIFKRIRIALRILYYFRIRRVSPDRLKEIYLSEI